MQVLDPEIKFWKKHKHSTNEVTKSAGAVLGYTTLFLIAASETHLKWALFFLAVLMFVGYCQSLRLLPAILDVAEQSKSTAPFTENIDDLCKEVYTKAQDYNYVDFLRKTGIHLGMAVSLHNGFGWLISYVFLCFLILDIGANISAIEIVSSYLDTCLTTLEEIKTHKHIQN